MTSDLHGSDEAPAAAIVTIGDELLTGERVDTNGAWIARTLSDAGFRIAWMTSVGDDEDGIGDALLEAGTKADLVVVTGGLGPTLDDRTRQAVAARWSLELREDPEIVDALQARFRARGYDTLPAANRRQALVPEGARVIPNPGGTAPALQMRLRIPPTGPAGAATPREVVAFLLPGIPREMEELLQGGVGGTIRDLFGGRLRPAEATLIRTTGVPESVLAGRIEAVLGPNPDIEVAYRPTLLGVELRLAARGPDARDRLQEAERKLARVLDGFRYEDRSGDLAGAVGRLLEERGLRIAVGESCTGGLVTKRLTDVPGSSAWVVGGVVAYDDRVKEEKLGVPRALLAAQGAVSEGVARALAEGAARSFGVEVGVGVTGIAGPGGAVPGKPVGTVWFAVSGPDGIRSESRAVPGDRRQVRERAAQHALHLVHRVLSLR